jgi:hypothetical protein
MSLITDTWRQLVRRRLWPIAVLLVGALVAVPVLLAKSPAVAPTAPAPASASETKAPAGDGLAEPVVAMADDSSRGRRHVLGARKDPFQPAPQPRPRATPSAAPHSAIAQQSPTGEANANTSPTFGGSTSGGGSTAPTEPSTPISGGLGPVTSPTTPAVPGTPTESKPKLAPGTLEVRFGDASGDSLTTLQVKKLDALPDPDQPVAIYLGPGRAKHSAVFLLDSTVKPEGDGSCLPSASDCEKLELRKGETEFLTATGDDSQKTQFELDLVDVGGRARAKSARAHHSRASRAHATRAGATVARVVRLLHP